jgi:hypothetical protein
MDAYTKCMILFGALPVGTESTAAFNGRLAGTSSEATEVGDNLKQAASVYRWNRALDR